MEKFWTFFIRKQQFAYLLVVAAIIFGLLAIVEIPKESSPEVRVPVGIVTTVFPGGSALDVERLITNEIEDRLSGSLTDLRKITSVSSESVSSIVVEFAADADLDSSIRELKDEVDKVKPDLPDDAEDPAVSDINFVDQPILTLAIAGDIPEVELQRIARDVKDEIVALSGVSRVAIGGEREREVRIIARKSALETFDITLSDIARAVQSNNTALPAGNLEIDGVVYTVQFEGDINDPDQVGGIAVAERNGTPIFLSDIADVSVGLSEAATISRISVGGAPSEPALSFDVFKQSGGNIAQVSDTVRERISELEKEGEILSDLSTLVVFDSGEFLREDLWNLTRTGMQTVFLVMLVLLVVIGWREALIAGIAVPSSFLIAFIALNASGNTINFISLFSLILAVGILVDSAIVMVEGIHTNMRKWMENPEENLREGEANIQAVDKKEAATRAIREFHWPITAGTMTTIAVFAPLFLISGVTGEFIASIPFTIIFVLFASLLVALGLIPLVSSVFLRRRTTSRLEELQEKYTACLRSWYKKRLVWMLENKTRGSQFIALIVVLFIFAFSLPFAGILAVEFFPEDDIDFVFVEIEEPQGTVIEITDLEMRAVEEFLYTHPDIDSFVATVGASSAFTGTGASGGGKFGNVFINLSKDRETTSAEVVEELRDLLSPIITTDITVTQPSGGPPVGAPIVITLLGDDLEKLDQVAADVERMLADIPGTANVRASTRDNSIEFVLSLDRAKAAALGIAPAEVAVALRSAVQGTEATTIKQSGEDIDVVVTLDLNPAYLDPHDTNRATLEAIQNIAIQTSNGSVLLGSILTSEVSESRPSIRHEDRERVVTVSSELGKGGNAIAILGEFNRNLNEYDMPESVSVSLGGENEDANQAFRDMFFATGLGLVLMLAVLVLQFNSYRYAMYVLSIVPFSLIGIFFGLTITGKAISFTSMMGFIALAGIVVNNSIILIDVINRLRRTNPERPVFDAVVEGSTMRLRPILLTTVTTVVGLIPLTFASAVWAPLAIAIMFGLLFSVFITLLLIPVIYTRWPGKLDGKNPVIKLPSDPKPLLGAPRQ